MYDVTVFRTGPAGAGWGTDTVTGSRRRALERRAELYERLGRADLRGVRVVDDRGLEVYPERWER